MGADEGTVVVPKVTRTPLDSKMYLFGPFKTNYIPQHSNKNVKTVYLNSRQHRQITRQHVAVILFELTIVTFDL